METEFGIEKCIGLGISALIRADEERTRPLRYGETECRCERELRVSMAERTAVAWFHSAEVIMGTDI